MDSLQEEKEEKEDHIMENIITNMNHALSSSPKKKLNPRLLLEWFERMQRLNSKITVNFYKKVLHKSELKIRGLEIYKEILDLCPSDEELLRIKRLVGIGPSIAKKVSGRTIDTLVTRFPRYYNVCYYLDVTDKDNITIVSNCSDTSRKTMLFDIGSSYRMKMHQYSKTYFDCFGRGDEVLHTLQSGDKLNISLCQFMFFIWAERFKVFEFLDREFDNIVVIRQQSQKNTYEPKRKRKPTSQIRSNTSEAKRLKHTVLSPAVQHGRQRRENTVIRMRRENPNNIDSVRTFQKQLIPGLKMYLSKAEIK
jgi:hypothetical protein